MKITQGLGLHPGAGANGNTIEKTLKQTQESFGETLSRAIKDVNTLQAEAGGAVQKMVTGEATDLHEVMVAVQKARTSFDLLMEVRNKAIEAYREIMRMQV